MAKMKDGCVVPAKGPIQPDPPDQQAESRAVPPQPKKENAMVAKVGKAAPDFEASAFTGKGFENIKLSDYRGKWVVLCFYPGDFTFV